MKNTTWTKLPAIKAKHGVCMTEDFKDTMSMPRRMDFRPASYEAAQSACHGEACKQGRKPCTTPDACRLPRESDFGALEGLVTARWLIVAPWILIIAAVAAAYLIWW